MDGVFVGWLRQLFTDLTRFFFATETEERIELEQKSVCEFFVSFDKVERVTAKLKGSFRISQRMYAELRSVEHGLKKGIIKSDSLLVEFQRLFVVAAQCAGKSEEVVSFGRITLDFHGAAC